MAFIDTVESRTCLHALPAAKASPGRSAVSDKFTFRMRVSYLEDTSKVFMQSGECSGQSSFAKEVNFIGTAQLLCGKSLKAWHGT